MKYPKFITMIPRYFTTDYYYLCSWVMVTVFVQLKYSTAWATVLSFPKLFSDVTLIAWKWSPQKYFPWTVACQTPPVRGILQARMLEWVTIPFSSRSSQPRDWTQVSCIAGRFFALWATGEAHGSIYTLEIAKCYRIGLGLSQEPVVEDLPVTTGHPQVQEQLTEWGENGFKSMVPLVSWHLGILWVVPLG